MGSVTIKDVAKAAGVSVAAVSMALNDVAGRVSADTREIIKKTANELGYAPNLNAKNLRISQKNLILLVYSTYFLEELNASPMQFMINVIKEAEKQGKQVIIQPTKKDVDWNIQIEEYVKLWNSNQIEGIIFVPAIEDYVPDNFFLELYRTHHVNFIAAHPEETSKNYPIVGVDMYLYMQQALTYLQNKGYQTIYYICMEYGAKPPKRAAAYIDYIKAHNLKGTVIKYQSFYRDKEELERLITPYIDNAEENIAFACWNDVDAINILEILRLKRLKSRYNIGVMGFDDLNISKFTVPALTTVYSPYKEMGKRAVDYILDSEMHKSKTPVNIQETAYLVERDSV